MEDDVELMSARAAPALTRAFRALGRMAADAYMDTERPGTRQDEDLVDAIITKSPFPLWDTEHLLGAWQAMYEISLSSTAGVIQSMLRLETSLPDHVGREILERGGTRRG